MLSQQLLCIEFPFLPQEQLPSRLPSLARELDPSGWTMCIVLGLKPDLFLVPTMRLAVTIVPTLKMLASDVNVSNTDIRI